MKNMIKKFSRELEVVAALAVICLLYTSDAADE